MQDHERDNIIEELMIGFEQLETDVAALQTCKSGFEARFDSIIVRVEVLIKRLEELKQLEEDVSPIIQERKERKVLVKYFKLATGNLKAISAWFTIVIMGGLSVMYFIYIYLQSGLFENFTNLF